MLASCNVNIVSLFHKPCSVTFGGLPWKETCVILKYFLKVLIYINPIHHQVNEQTMHESDGTPLCVWILHENCLSS